MTIRYGISQTRYFMVIDGMTIMEEQKMLDRGFDVVDTSPDFSSSVRLEGQTYEGMSRAKKLVAATKEFRRLIRNKTIDSIIKKQ